MSRAPIVVTLAIALVAAAAAPARAQDEEPMAETRLRRAIETTRAAEAEARPATDEARGHFVPRPESPEDGDPERFPLFADAAAHDRARPWLARYRPEQGRADDAWPQPADGAALRALLEHADAGVRGLAVEALATLHAPEDIPRIAELLGDAAESVPALGHNRRMTAMPFRLGESLEGGPDAPVLSRSWHRRTVAAYARTALHLMTGKRLTAETFAAWWERTGDPRHTLWYWQRRLERDVIAAERMPAALGVENVRPFAERRAEAARRAEEAVAVIAAELAELPAEVEAKVMLLAEHPGAGGAPMTDPARRFWRRFETTRLPRERLLELIEGKDLWPDVDWDGDGAHYVRLVERIALAAERHLQAEDAERILRCAETSGRTLWWSGRAAVVIGASRVLPAAGPEALDDPATRDGVLRRGVREGSDPFVRGYIARELVQVALEPSWPFLREQVFSEGPTSHVPDVPSSVIEALGAEPRTPAKRRALRELLLDERFAAFWIRSNREGMGRDGARMRAIAAVAAHAGRPVVTREDDAALNDPEVAAERLPGVLAKVAEALR